MMMNQVDSRSFDGNKDDDKKPKECFQDWVNKFKIKFKNQDSRFKNNQDQDLRLKIQKSREDLIKISI